MTETPFEKINKMNILDVLDRFNIPYEKNGNGYVILNKDGSKDKSFSISISKNIAKDFGKTDISGGNFDIIGRYHLWFSKEDMWENVARVATLKAFEEVWLIKLPKGTYERKESFKKDELLERFEEFKLWWYKDEVGRWLVKRGFKYDWVKSNYLKIGEVFRDIGFYDNYFCSEHELKLDNDWKIINDPNNPPGFASVLLFPNYDWGGDNKILIGMKMRRVDGKTIFGQKSYAVGFTGIMYRKTPKGISYICEWECDGIVLEILWFDWVVSNNWWVLTNWDKIKSLLFECTKINCLYDNDDAGMLGKRALAKEMWRPIFQVDMPITQDSKGRKISDINDLFKVWYDTNAKWKKVFDNFYEIWDSSLHNKKNGQRYIFLDKYLEFYDTKFNKVQMSSSISLSMGITWKELNKMVMDGVILKYEDLCYRYGGREGFFNTLNEDSIILHWGDQKAIIHPYIEKLMSNICGHSKKNINWLHKAILYKITHINDVNIPAVILYWRWGSWKGTFISLLAAIFGDENTQIGLGQNSLESWYDSYIWNKLIVEFKEVSSWSNIYQDKKTLDKIKSFICEPIMTINPKYHQARQIENIAWFHMSSNHGVPLYLDNKQTWNRRFSIIKTSNELNKKIAIELNTKIIKDKDIVKQYVAWLHDTYPEVPNMDYMPELKNEEKKMLEDNCDWVWDQFFEWFEQEYPNIYKITNIQRWILLEMYRNIEWDNSYWDKKFIDKNFDMSLSHRYEKKTIKILGKSTRGYFIKKDKAQKEVMPEGNKWEFTKEQWKWVLDRRDKINFNKI